LDLPIQEPQLCVTCLYSPDSAFKVKVSELQNLQSDTDKIIFNAKCYIIDNEIDTINLSLKNKYYYSEVKPQAGHIYKLVVECEGYRNVEAIDTLPEQAPSYSFQNELLTFFKSSVLVYSNMTMNLDDKTATKDYYEIKIYHFDTLYYVDNGYSEEPIGEDCDTVYQCLPLVLSSNDFIIQDESLIDYYPKAVFFSDAKFQNSLHTFIIRYPEIIYSPGQLRPYKLILSVKKSFRNYYLFRRFAVLQYYYQNRDTWLDNIEPVQMYSNVKNGIGIFAGYIENKDTIEIPLVNYNSNN
jgi:hypothetical protein